MGEGTEFVVEPGKRQKPVVALPRFEKNEHGERLPPVVEVFVEFARGVAGCCVCDRPIPKQTSRIAVKVALRQPVAQPNGRSRNTERYYMHPGCLTERIKPEIIRFGFDCYDCGEPPPKREVEGPVVPLRWSDWCFTVSRFSPAPICKRCAEKPKWVRCDICSILYPPWMISALESAAVSAPDGPLDVFTAIPPTVIEARACCQHCAQRWSLRTTADAERARAEFERLRDDIVEHGFYEAGE